MRQESHYAIKFIFQDTLTTGVKTVIESFQEGKTIKSEIRLLQLLFDIAYSFKSLYNNKPLLQTFLNFLNKTKALLK